MVKIALARAGSAEQAKDAEPALTTSEPTPVGAEPAPGSEDAVDVDPVVEVLIPAAWAAAAALHAQGRRVTRKALADVAGHLPLPLGVAGTKDPPSWSTSTGCDCSESISPLRR